MCPVTGLLGLAALGSGSRILFVHDRRYRLLSWTLALFAGVAWTAYFTVARRPELRIGLEIASVCALLAAVLRVRHLVRARTAAPAIVSPLPGALGALANAIRSPWVAGLKGWLLAMVVIDATGRASFSAWEYAVVATLLAVLLGASVVRRPARPRFGALRSFDAGAQGSAACPLGFGAAPKAER